MDNKTKIVVAAVAVAVVAGGAWLALGGTADPQAGAAGGQGASSQAATTSQSGAAAAPAARPALVVVPVRPDRTALPVALVANGTVAAWQEASIGAETGGLRLREIRANVGDTVKRGQVLAEFAGETPAAELAQAKASVAEAEAALLEAQGNAERARSIESTGALSAQQISQYKTAETTATARVEAARAALAVSRLRVSHTRVTASDDGVISHRSPVATVGAVVPQGQELFRLVRQSRLEWRGEVTAAQLGGLRAGQIVDVTVAGGKPVQGKVRAVAPTVDPQTRNALVYVDLPPSATQGANAPVKAGMFGRGEFEMGNSEALTLPRQAVVVRDGFNYVFRIGADQRVAQAKVETGRRTADRVEILSGLAADATVVGEGAGFLNDGDLVQVVETAKAASAESQATAAAAAGK